MSWLGLGKRKDMGLNPDHLPEVKNTIPMPPVKPIKRGKRKLSSQIPKKDRRNLPFSRKKIDDIK